MKLWARSKAAKRIDSYETIRIKEDGTLINVSLTISPITDANGNFIGVSKIARDITRRINAEQALVFSEANLKEFSNLKWLVLFLE